MVTALQSRAAAAGVRIEMVERAEGGMSARMDGELIKLALSNLIDNAIAFSPMGACVRVMVQASDNAGANDVEIVVSDEGPGLDASVIGRVGERFVSTARPNGAPKSSGLGLAIVKQIVELHHGSLSLVNTGRGARAVIRMPLA